MSKYLIKKNNVDQMFYIIESETKFPIDRFLTYNKAVDTVRRLKRGNGFNGFTPLFFVDQNVRKGAKIFGYGTPLT